MKSRIKELLYVVAVFLQKFLTAVSDVLWLVLLAELIGEVLPGNGVTGNKGKMAQYILGLVLLSAWKRMGYSFGRSLTLKLQNMVRFRLNCRMVEKTAKIPYRLLEDYTFNELKQALQKHISGNEVGSFVWYMVQQSGNLMMYGIRMLGVSLLLAWESVPLGLLFFLLEICHCLVTALGIEQGTFLRGKSSPEKQYLEELALGQKGAGERSLFSYAGYIAEKQDREEEIVRREDLALLLEKQKTELVNQVLSLLTYVLEEIGLTALLAGGRITLGYFIALSIGISSLIEKNEEGNALRHVQRERLFVRQWNRFMNLPEMEEKENRCVIQEEFETLEFRKVSFRYPRTGRYVLRDLSFRLTKGGYYAFVGVNGSGKTTIVKLLSGLYDNYEGEIRLNGVELREISVQERRRIFAILFQDAARYEDTVIQNIMPGSQIACARGQDLSAGHGKERIALSKRSREYFTEESGRGNSGGENFGRGNTGGENFGRENSGGEELSKKEFCGKKSAARQLAEELVAQWSADRNSRFPQGIDTFLGSVEEDGVMLSTGEWQQLLIARELAQTAQIRIMDEPMASLDIFRQARVYEQFTENGESRTTILFSHHMAAARMAKRIFVLKEGAIIEEGSHRQLMDQKGVYAQMYGIQCEDAGTIRAEMEFSGES